MLSARQERAHKLRCLALCLTLYGYDAVLLDIILPFLLCAGPFSSTAKFASRFAVNSTERGGSCKRETGRRVRDDFVSFEVGLAFGNFRHGSCGFSFRRE